VTRSRPRATPVFAAEQVDGYQAPVSDAAPATIITPIEQAEAFVAATGASIHHGGTRAFYRPSRDSIHVPLGEAFIGTKTSTPAESYYSTLCHELCHNAEPSVMPRRSGFARKNASKPALPFGIIRAIQEREESIVGPIPSRPRVGRGHACQGLLFKTHVGMHVDLRCLDGLMSEPQGNDGSVHAVLKEVHRGTVAQDVWAYAFSDERGARLGCRQSVFSDDVFHGVATELGASDCWEDGIVIRTGALLKPCFDCFDRVAAKRSTAPLAPLAFATDMRARSEYHVAAIEIVQLRDAQARLRASSKIARSRRPTHVDRSGAANNASISVRSMKSPVRRT
jgi:hypothetical protein